MNLGIFIASIDVTTTFLTVEKGELPTIPHFPVTRKLVLQNQNEKMAKRIIKTDKQREREELKKHRPDEPLAEATLTNF